MILDKFMASQLDLNPLTQLDKLLLNMCNQTLSIRILKKHQDLFLALLERLNRLICKLPQEMECKLFIMQQLRENLCLKKDFKLKLTQTHQCQRRIFLIK